METDERIVDFIPMADPFSEGKLHADRGADLRSVVPGSALGAMTLKTWDEKGGSQPMTVQEGDILQSNR